MASFTITPGRPLRGTVTIPGDKSVTHRAIILTALAEGLSTVSGYCRGEDCLNTMRAFRSLGVRIDETPDCLQVHGKGMWGLSEPFGPIDCGNSGTGIRLMAGLLAGQDFFTVLTGDDSIRRRPMGRVVKPLRTMGAVIAGRKGGELAPLAITGTRLKGIAYASPVASAQIKSSLLFAALYADGVTTLSEPRLSRDHTERMFAYFRIPFQRDGLTLRLDGRPSVRWGGKPVVVPGDLSAAAFFLVGATIVPDSDVTVRTVGINPTRTGLLDVLRAMGAQIDLLNPREEAGEPVADLRVRSAPLRGVQIGPEQIPQTIDEFPILCVAAAVAEGETVISGAEELRVKESDRIATMATELRAMGAQIEERPDGMVIRGLGRPGANGALKGATCTSHGDHRVAMSVAIGALTAGKPTLIQDTACIETSFPGFERTLAGLLTGAEKPL
ncbi:MAG: 3-phosphoshikimate 1-carboxyvinyltransferase 1 [Nitrospirae bacterium]|nr:3-phosphoshikimate 1-carboxyvinyltransferase 1 [Nitrospirota bacterium]MCE7964580.1 3-phosphoshikimate 1-carboxyvinyltransferase [Nitrospira sp. NTP2]MCK6493772.1 3-phosphoshikimate 1-carboxyvinyltransferase [Nitrospira sp.]MEB2338324.1 3-phosphoshikimate 1-carboxyvinyltransferase [Nitrospirales bacterium]QOJ35109.1 MAG: 3-phosphoshikimate 1-carboxyvinyltransferase [Nitrospira sp.]